MNVLFLRLLPFQLAAPKVIEALRLLDRIGYEVFAFLNLASIGGNGRWPCASGRQQTLHPEHSQAPD
jgi:hypothetical protein